MAYNANEKIYSAEPEQSTDILMIQQHYSPCLSQHVYCQELLKPVEISYKLCFPFWLSLVTLPVQDDSW